MDDIQTFRHDTTRVMKLKDWLKYVVPIHEIIYNSSVDSTDMNAKVKKLRPDSFVNEPIGVSTACTLSHIFNLSNSLLNSDNNREKPLLCAFSPNSERGRRRNQVVNRPNILKTLSKNGFCNKPLGTRYWNELLLHKFVASPEGNGIQCHRTYEALYWKAIPIVEDNKLSKDQLKGLPILFTHDFSEITEEYLLKKYNEMLETEYDFNFLFLSYFPLATQNIIKRRGDHWSHQVNRVAWWDHDLSKIKNCENIFEDINFITMTNNGYKELTLNCLKSLSNISQNINLEVFCLDEESQNYLKPHCEYTNLFSDTVIKDELKHILSKLTEFEDSNWCNVTFQKLFLISLQLKQNKFVLFTDGDIVFKDPMFFPYLYKTMLENPETDMFIQNEWRGPGTSGLCTGFFIVRQNKKTLDFFDVSTLKKHNPDNKKNDQDYLNTFQKQMNIKKLSLEIFPNGKYYYQNMPISPYMIHFNYLKGLESKKKKMKNLRSWFL
jgi:hypothetical protein